MNEIYRVNTKSKPLLPHLKTDTDELFNVMSLSNCWCRIRKCAIYLCKWNI